MKLIAVLIVLLIIMLLVRISYENRHFRVVQYVIVHEKINKELDGTRIAFLSDLHCQTYGEDNEQLVNRLKEEQPDLILIGGDMMVRGLHASYEEALALIDQLLKIAPVYYGNGNHESKMKFSPEVYGEGYAAYAKQLADMGVHHLCNESALFKDKALCITGLELENRYYKKLQKTSLSKEEITQAAGQADSLYFQLLLAHNPVYFEAYEDWGADLVLSGHVHGGMINLPFLGGVFSPQIQFFPKYDGGLFQIKKSSMVLSRGLGSHTVKIRLRNQPELCMITLKEK